MNEEQKELINKSILLWGQQAQFDQLHEEIGELMVALNHLKRNRCELKDVIIELADVRLMLNAIQILLGIKDEEYEAIENGQWAKWKKQLEKNKKCGCERCGASEADYVADPYKSEIDNVEEMKWLCDACYDDIAADI